MIATSPLGSRQLPHMDAMFGTSFAGGAAAGPAHRPPDLGSGMPVPRGGPWMTPVWLQAPSLGQEAPSELIPGVPNRTLVIGGAIALGLVVVLAIAK